MSENNVPVPEVPFWDRAWVAITALFVFFPVGIYLILKNKELSQNAKYAWFGGFAFLMVISIMSDNKPDRPRQAQAQAAPVAQKPTPIEKQVVQKVKQETPQKSKPVGHVSRANYEKLKDGMALDKVQEIIGVGKEVGNSGAISSYTYQSGNMIISVVFNNKKLASRSIVDF